MTSALAVVSSAPAPLAYAFTLGLVAAVNPCGFPLLPAYLAIFAGVEGEAGPLRRTMRGLVAGASVSLGFVLVFGVLGLLVESGISLVVGWVPWVMIPVAAFMTVVGVLTALGREVHVRVPALRGGSSRHVVGMVGFGVAYAVASLSCALPVFLAGVAGSFGRLGFLTGTATFVAYALGMGLLLVVLSLVVAHLGISALRRIRPVTRFVPRAAGAVLALVGLYLSLYWVSDLVDPTATPAPVRVVEDVQSSVSGWLAGSSRLIGLVLGVVVVVVLAVLAGVAARRPPEGAHGGQQVSTDPVASSPEDRAVRA